MKKKGNRIQNIAEALDFPLDVISDIPRSEIMGNCQLSIENIRGVLDYNENCIKINTTVGIIKIDGDELFIDNISDENIFVKGRIIRLEYI
ncbi:MAG: sporulation protein YqfC [Ruminococcaceae bacterium]|nr:sporulation protein YqfC [Oscillospiraceae bacterium]